MKGFDDSTINWWVPQNCKVTAGNILLVFLNLPYVPADQACAHASCKVRQHKTGSPGTFFPVNFLGERGLVFLLPALLLAAPLARTSGVGGMSP